MKILQLILLTSILTLVTARVLGPQTDEARKKTKVQNKQEEEEGVIVDPVITVSEIQVYENPSPSTENSVELSSSSLPDSNVSSEVATPVHNEDDANPINRYCKCTSFECDCCREFSLPLVPIRGPGCANIRYLEGDRMSVGIKFGNRVLANRVISGRKETPVCLPLPGGFTNFCGRIYGISKKNEDFKACLGLELRADEEVEAALRVSCFSFGPKGLKVMEAEPIPVASVDEDEDDDDDIFGLESEDDEEDEDDDILSDDDTPTGQSVGSVPNPSNNSDDDDDETDYTGLGLLSGDFLDDILGDDDQSSEAAPARKNAKKKTKEASKPEVSLSTGGTNGIDNSSNDSDNDDDDEDESAGILEILNDLISDDEESDDDEDEKVEDEISEEIVDNEIEDSEDVIEETDETSPLSDKENEIETQDDRDEEELAEAVDDDDDDDDDESELEEKPTTYSTLSLLGLRNLFSRFFK